MKKYVLDISRHQGKVDFEKVKAAGISGVILKCTEGTGYVSPVFKENYKAAKAAGLEVGAYHFLRAASTVPACKEGRWFGKNIEGMELELGLALDIEHEGCNWDNYQGDPLTPTAAYNVINGFAQNVEKYGFHRNNLALYASIDYFNRFLTDPDVQAYRRWLANPSHLAFNKPVIGVQYSWEGQVDGVENRVDLNVWLDSPQRMEMAQLSGEPAAFKAGMELPQQPEPQPEANSSEEEGFYHVSGTIGEQKVDLTISKA